jgi:hypothetical protein
MVHVVQYCASSNRTKLGFEYTHMQNCLTCFNLVNCTFTLVCYKQLFNTRQEIAIAMNESSCLLSWTSATKLLSLSR